MKPRLLPATLTALKIVNLLKEWGDQNHPVAQTAIASALDVDRKTVSRCLEVLQGHMDYDIVHEKRGVYLIPDDDAFELSEIRLLIDSVLASKVISAEQTDTIVQKLSKLLNKHDRTHIRHIHAYKNWSKVENAGVFWTVEVMDDAINKRVQVSFDYNAMGVDKKLHVKSCHVISPIQLVFANGQYFVLALVDGEQELCSFRIDRITNVKLLDVPSRQTEKEIRWSDIASTYAEGHPYMSFGDTEFIRLRIVRDEIGRVFDVFGTKVWIAPCSDEDERYENMVEVTFRANTEDVYRFMVLNADVAEIMEPHSVRARILKFGRRMHTRYLSTKEDFAQANYESAIGSNRHLHRSEDDVICAGDEDVRRLIERNGTAHKIWGISVDRIDDTIRQQIMEYSNLKELSFIRQESADLSVLEAFPQLDTLRVRQDLTKLPPSKVTGLHALHSCPKLWHVEFFNTDLTDGAVFAGMRSLKLLELRHCKLRNLDFLRDIPSLMRMEISGEGLEDIAGLYEHENLRVLITDAAFVKKFDIDYLRSMKPKLRIIVRAHNVGFSYKDLRQDDR